MLYRMALNLMVDRARGEQRATARDTAWRQVARTELGGVDISDEPAADDAAASAQRLRQLVAAVERLPPRPGALPPARSWRPEPRRNRPGHGPVGQGGGKHVSAPVRRSPPSWDHDDRRIPPLSTAN
jgi:hypothetical protein